MFSSAPQRRTPLSDRLDPAAPAAAGKPPTPARAARMAKFRREQVIVGYLNRGVSVAEIAARVGVGPKRLRAIVRDILARRMPHPPMEFVAIQVSRLNEALLVAYSAMSPTNLKAVDQVVKIVRELDRYGGAFAAEWARPEASRLHRASAPEALTGQAALAEPDLEAETIADEDRLFARRWLDGDELTSAGDGDESRAERAGSIEDVIAELLRRCTSPENPVQAIDKMDSAPGFSDAFADRAGESRASGAAAATLDRDAPGGARTSAFAGLTVRLALRRSTDPQARATPKSAARARKSRRKALITFNPRPELGRRRGPSRLGAPRPRPAPARRPSAPHAISPRLSIGSGAYRRSPC